jgi:hypothetical protein
MKPPYVSRYPLSTHCRLCTEKPRSCRIDGSATLTIDASTKSRKPTMHRNARVNLPRPVARNDGGPGISLIADDDIQHLLVSQLAD